MFRLDGKRAVVTGAASGIGAAVARLFSNSGATVVAVDLQREQAESIAEQIGGETVGERCSRFRGDHGEGCPGRCAGELRRNRPRWNSCVHHTRRLRPPLRR